MKNATLVVTFLASQESRLLVESLLGPRGYTVLHGSPRFPPLQSIRLHRPDLILVEMDSEELSGLEMVSRIRKDPLYSDLVTVGLGHDDGGIIQKISLVAGCTGFIHYPLDSETFTHRLEGYLAGIRDELGEDERLLFHRLFSEALVERIEKRIEDLEEKNVALESEREKQKNLTLQVLTSLATLLETKDPYTRGHSGQVTTYALALGEKVGIRGQSLKVLERASLLHDIGKIALDLAEIHKPGPLNGPEKVRVDLHSEFGSKILAPIDFLQDEAMVVRFHHCRYENYGRHPEITPRVRKLASIITLADSFDAMTSYRSYNKPKPLAAAIEEIRRCAGTQFDPALVEAFVDLLQSGQLAVAPMEQSPFHG